MKRKFNLQWLGLDYERPQGQIVKRWKCPFATLGPSPWAKNTHKFLSLSLSLFWKHEHTFALIQVWRQFLHTFMANYSSWTIDFILLAHYWINSKYYKQVNFFKIWFKKKKKTNELWSCVWDGLGLRYFSTQPAS